jgi:hypothetical protein
MIFTGQEHEPARTLVAAAVDPSNSVAYLDAIFDCPVFA